MHHLSLLHGSVLLHIVLLLGHRRHGHALSHMHLRHVHWIHILVLRCHGEELVLLVHLVVQVLVSIDRWHISHGLLLLDWRHFSEFIH